MNTRARIATLCQARYPATSVDQMRQHTLSLLSLAASQKSDLVCLPETCVSPSVQLPLEQLAETVPGPTTDAAGRIARQHRCYVICPLVTWRDGAFLNSAIVIGRAGEIIGIYDKLQPVTSSPDYTLFESGTMPGRHLPLFDLDFGRVGIQICFDAGFPQHWQRLADEGARAVFWCSAYNGGYPLQTYAALHGYYVISSVRTDRAKVIDPCGTVLAETDAIKNVICRDINLDYALCHSDFNYGIPDRIAEKYGDRVDVRSHTDAGLFLVEPTDPSLTIAQLQQELGFETRQAYFRRHQCAYDQLQAGQAPVPQQAAHGTRPMYSKK